MDVFTPQKRSEIMSRIRSKDTKAERIVFSYLRQHKIYFQKHYTRIAGNPDIALPRKKLAVFIDGDFWHGRNMERVNKLPEIYWKDKIKGNIERDKINREKLINAGWKILQVWEGDLVRKRTRDATLYEIQNFLMH